MKSGRRMLWVVCVACLLLWAGAALPAGAESTEFVVHAQSRYPGLLSCVITVCSSA